MGEGQRLGGALLVKAVTTIATVVLSVCEGEGSPAPHANVGIDPFGWLTSPTSATFPQDDRGGTYSTAVNHAACNGDAGGELKALPLQGLADLTNVDQVVATLSSGGPGLYQLKDPRSYLRVNRGRPNRLQQRHQVIHEFPRGNFGKEMCAAVLDACICKLTASQSGAGALQRLLWDFCESSYIQCAQLRVGVLVANALFEGAHGFLRLHRLRPDDIGNLEVEGNVLTAVKALDGSDLVVYWKEGARRPGRSVESYRLLLVAFSICSSRAPLAPEDHHVIMLGKGFAEDTGHGELVAMERRAGNEACSDLELRSSQFVTEDKEWEARAA